jgi:uncharacterized membrane protein
VSDGYVWWKTLHVLSATILFGTGLGTAFFCWFGSRRALHAGDLGSLRTVLRLTVLADWVFTAPAVLLQAASGAVLIELLGWSWRSAWTIAVVGLFLLVGACWLPVVALQLRLRAAAETVASIAELPPAFHRWFRWWFALGVPAFAAVVVLVYLMVGKPLPVVSAPG